MPYARKNSWDSSQNPKFISLISGWLSNFDESLWFPQSFHLLTICQSKINTIFSSIECLSFVSKSVFQLNFLLILFESSDKYVVIKMHQVKKRMLHWFTCERISLPMRLFRRTKNSFTGIVLVIAWVRCSVMIKSWFPTWRLPSTTSWSSASFQSH